MDTIRDRFCAINQKIEEACVLSGRKFTDLKLIVVTKGQSVEKILEVVDAGSINLGENYPEETIIKIEKLKRITTLQWHMIGHLQSRKIKLIYPDFYKVHSIDSLSLAEKINKFYQTKNSVCEILLELNIAGEASKYGFDASSIKNRDNLLVTIENLLQLKNLHIGGLMTMPPVTEKPENNEIYFNNCREFMEKINNHFSINLTDLSMGTSMDFESAIKCGATYVRVGEAIMGKRNYNL